MSWVWREQRPWNPAGCSRLVEAGFFSGQVDYLPAGALGDGQLASKLYWAASVDPFRGSWSGPVYVLTDGKTASSAEMFSAVLRDNGIAKIVGGPTAGDGGGFMYHEAPIELPHSHFRFQMPNCIRLRADGSNEVAGIQPDLPVLPVQGESPRARAARLLEAIDDDLRPSQSMRTERQTRSK
jgi:C-terminal processing protease CtpA/Prc